MNHDDQGLAALGWGDAWQAAFAALAQPGPRGAREPGCHDSLLPGWRPARVVLEHGRFLRVHDGRGERLAEAAGKLRHAAASAADLPTVGDWVAISDRDAKLVTVNQVLPRRTRLSRTRVGGRGRQPGGRATEQVVAANVDVVLLMMGLDDDFNLRRLERYLALAHTAGVAPVLVLNKADRAPDLPGQRAGVEALAPGLPVVVTTLSAPEGAAPLLAHLGPRTTAAVLGSSGVGKSTFLNHVAGQAVQRTAEVRASDRRGRHTTSYAQLFMLPGGALLIDTPGLREVQPWEGGVAVGATFADVEAFTHRCRFDNCRHGDEPGCAVQDALVTGELDPARWASFRKLQAEQLGRGGRRR
jgi:ribosome biogenesis GTPase / thiamine phosphate phosphatase